MRSDLIDANKAQIAEMERLKQIDLMEATRVENDQKSKEDRDTMRKEREEARFKEKQAVRQKMIDRQI